jgi:hypothetical protein
MSTQSISPSHKGNQVLAYYPFHPPPLSKGPAKPRQRRNLKPPWGSAPGFSSHKKDKG